MPMLLPSSESWRATLRQALERYDAPLLRRVAARLLRPRGQWPVDELVNRCVAATENAPLVDRRLQELDAGCRAVLAAVGFSGQPRWRLGSLTELAMALGATDCLEPVRALLESGFFYPLSNLQVRSFEAWLGSSPDGGWVLVPPAMAARARGEEIAFPDAPRGVPAKEPTFESDGLEWPVRLAVTWQQVVGAPLRRTQQGDFFKRDAERLDQDSLLNAPAVEGLAELPQPGRLAVALAESLGILQAAEGELRAGDLPETWDHGLARVLQSLWAALPRVDSWDALGGWRSAGAVGNPFPSAYLLAFLLLARLQDNEWTRPADIEAWISTHHPYWNGQRPASSDGKAWTSAFLLGLAHQLRFVQAAKDAGGEWVVRLSPLGRWLAGSGEPPALETPFQQTLLVQPNLEIVAYRQGLTPSLIGRLTKFAQWKSLGAACILQLEPKSVYRALESGLTFTGVLQCLDQHGTRP
ncbi:MAG TPA: hypothetical protein VKE94_22885, partial [Gemmataceae bacterium]|nr:hypothetical protein [Gemmataceae bacterium]